MCVRAHSLWCLHAGRTASPLRAPGDGRRRLLTRSERRDARSFHPLCARAGGAQADAGLSPESSERHRETELESR